MCVFGDFLQTLSLGENKLYECKVLWNRIVKGIEILIFKDFCTIYESVKSMVGEWCGIIVIHKK
jgi:hypothetical protein